MIFLFCYFISVQGIVPPKNLNSVDSVMVFYVYTIIYSKVVLNLSEFLFSAERKCYFEEQGKPNSCWSSVTSIFSLLSNSMSTSNCLVSFILQNIFVQHKKEMNTGLGQRVSE